MFMPFLIYHNIILIHFQAGPLGRSADAGRGWEGFSPDPYLTGIAMKETIEAMQESGVQACAKHWIGNEQETQRNPGLSPTNKTIEAVSANIDDRTMHELYMWPFADAVKAGVSSMMVRPSFDLGTDQSTDGFIVFVQQTQRLLCLPEQQGYQRPAQGRAWLPGLCNVGLGGYPCRCG